MRPFYRADFPDYGVRTDAKPVCLSLIKHSAFRGQSKISSAKEVVFHHVSTHRMLGWALKEGRAKVDGEGRSKSGNDPKLWSLVTARVAWRGVRGLV